MGKGNAKTSGSYASLGRFNSLVKRPLLLVKTDFFGSPWRYTGPNQARQRLLVIKYTSTDILFILLIPFPPCGARVAGPLVFACEQLAKFCFLSGGWISLRGRHFRRRSLGSPDYSETFNVVSVDCFSEQLLPARYSSRSIHNI
jgi:hypothetical protein